jgi:serine phosphatase RsbU (regulator of sigma subunit)
MAQDKSQLHPIRILVRSATPAGEARIVKKLSSVLIELKHIKVIELSKAKVQDGVSGQILVLDAAGQDHERWLSGFSGGFSAIWLWLEEGAPLPELFIEGKVDDLLIHPLRPLEILSKLKHYEQHRIATEVLQIQSSLDRVMKDLSLDLEVLERLQKARLPVRFKDVKGFQITSRYIAGERSGGDYFDLAESADGNQLAMLVSDSSSYGLSSAVLSAVARVISRVTVEQSRSVREMVRSFYEELLRPLSPKDRLSIFYATLSRKDYVLRFLGLGSVRAFYRGPHQKGFVELESQGGPLSQASRHALSSPQLKEGVLVWEPGGRLVVLSDGFLDSLGGNQAALELLDRFALKGGKDLLNELTFGIKSKLVDPKEDLPAQDCTGMVLDLDPKVIRLV